MSRQELEHALKLVSVRMREELERFLAGVDFAEGLCELHPEEAEAWRPLIAQATGIVRSTVRCGELDALQQAVRGAETLMAPIGEVAKTYTVYCVGHAHIDMNWMWSWPETVAVTNDTFSTVLQLMDENPDFCFTQSQASVYQIVERYNPPMLDRIRERVAEGRWEVAASHWVEGDKNLVDGEALCRHLLYTRRYMQELLGLAPEDVALDWSPDTFGHAATIPAYLARGGVTRYYACRLGKQGPERPPVFWWQAPDGSRVLVNREIRWYLGALTPDVGKAMIEFARQTGLRAWMRVYGVGDHGGGPTRRDLRYAREMDAWPVFPNIRLSTTGPFYSMLEEHGDRHPVLQCEMNFEFTGCYTSQSLIKRSNRLAENQLSSAEAAAAVAWAATGRPYPSDELRERWQDALFTHFHDILPGSGIRDTRTYTHGKFQEIAATTGMTETLSLRALAARVDTSAAASEEQELPASMVPTGFGAGVGFGTTTGATSAAEAGVGHGPRPFLVFNPCAHARDAVVTATIWDPPDPEGAFHAADSDGNRSAAQVLDTGKYWGHSYVTLAFPVRGVPGFGYALYTVAEGPAEGEGGVRTFGRFGMENGLLSVDVDPATGGLRSLRLRESGVNVVDGQRPAGVLEYAVERPHNMSAWNLGETGPVTPLEVRSVKRTASGPHLAAVEVAARIHDSEFTLRYELEADSGSLRIKVEGTWLERGGPEIGVPSLRMCFPLALRDVSARYEIPFGSLERDLRHGEEVPALRWAQLEGLAAGQEAGCTLVNNCKHGHSLCADVLRVSLIRSSYSPDPLPEMGRHEMEFTLSPFQGKRSPAQAARLGLALNRPLRVVGTSVHTGELPARTGLLSVSPESVLPMALKKAEGEDALVLRLCETAGHPTRARIELDPPLGGNVTSAVEVDLLERQVGDVPLDLDEAGACVDIPAFGIVSVLLRTEPSA